MGLVGRLKLYDWTLELIGVGLIVGLIALFTFGAQLNKSYVSSVVTAIKPVLDDNFYQVGASKDQLLVKDSPTLFTLFSTGRINFQHLTAQFKLAPRQNLFFYFLETVVSFFFESVPAPADSVQVVLKPSQDNKIGNYIFAIVNKDGMNNAREENYYLSLTKTTESSTLPTEFVFMSESNELNNGLITEQLTAVLAKSSKFLKFLAITDLPAEKPVSEREAQSSPELILSLKLATSKEDLETIKELISQFIELGDRASNFQLKADQQKKIHNVRVAEITKILKAIQAQKDEELKEQRLEAEREARRLKEKTLSPEAQDKLDKKQREKRERRAKNKQMKRM